MNALELLDIIGSGETSCVQFKEKWNNDDSIASEMIAMSNSKGGLIIFGVRDKTGEILGLGTEELQNYGSSLATIANNSIKPSIFIFTDVVPVSDEKGGATKRVLVVNIEEGSDKPYKDRHGAIWVKQGPDKIRVTDNNKIKRLFQQNGSLSADELPVKRTNIDSIDEKLFADYFKKEFGQTYQKEGLSFEKALEVKKIIKNGEITLAGLLFFGKTPQTEKPAFTVKAVSFVGNDPAGKRYKSKPPDFKGTIPKLFDQAMDFCSANLQHLQKDKRDFNSKGSLEVSYTALKELIVNALVHRDYFKNAPVRIFVFDNRIEIISPGVLPNSLTVDEIKHGNPVIRNNQIMAFASRLLPYSGYGTGIRRALNEQPNIEFINNFDGEQFIVKIPRPGK